MGGGGVQQHTAAALGQLYRLAGGVVGQAEECGVGLLEGLTAGVGVLAQFLGQFDQPNAFPARQPLADAQAGGAGAAVDKDLFAHFKNSLT